MRARLRFEREARSRHPDLTSTASGRGRAATVTYRLTLPVTEYDARRVSIQLVTGYEPYGAKIAVDGPSESPHRYPDGSLCVWHPRDREDRKWVGADGLHDLTVHVAIHLFKEAYWRETGEWLGPEAPHVAAKEPEADAES